MYFLGSQLLVPIPSFVFSRHSAEMAHTPVVTDANGVAVFSDLSVIGAMSNNLVGDSKMDSSYYNGEFFLFAFY